MKGARPHKPTPEQEDALQEVLNGEREVHVSGGAAEAVSGAATASPLSSPVRKWTRNYQYGRSRANDWPLWISWLLAPSKDARQRVRVLMEIRRG